MPGKNPRNRKNWDHPDIVRGFWARVNKCPNCDCQLFEGALNRGWGRLKVWHFPGCLKNAVMAHRYSYALRHGPIPEGFDIHHDHEICNHRNCIDSDHLAAVDHNTHGEISADFHWPSEDVWTERLELF